MFGFRFWLLSTGSVCAVVTLVMFVFAIEHSGWPQHKGVIISTTTNCQMRATQSGHFLNSQFVTEIDCSAVAAFKQENAQQQWLVLEQTKAQIAVSNGKKLVIGEMSLPRATYPDPHPGNVVPVLQNPSSLTDLQDPFAARLNWPAASIAFLLTGLCFYFGLRPRPRRASRTEPAVALPKRNPVIETVRNPFIFWNRR